MAGPFIASWLRMLFSRMAAARPISASDFMLPGATNTGAKPNGGRRNTVAAAKREAIRDRRRKDHKRACR